MPAGRQAFRARGQQHTPLGVWYVEHVRHGQRLSFLRLSVICALNLTKVGQGRYLNLVQEVAGQKRSLIEGWMGRCRRGCYFVTTSAVRVFLGSHVVVMLHVVELMNKLS